MNLAPARFPIKFTMQSPFYRKICKRHGIEVITPEDSEQDEINRIIFKELVLGIFKEETRTRLLEIISKYESKTDGVILGCTELPMILSQKHTRAKLLSTTDLHAEAALDWAMGG